MKQSHYIIYTVLLAFATSPAKSQIPCDTINAKICRSIVTNVAYNPYVTGVLGNWRANKTYTWYNDRAETSPTTQTDIRRNGTFANFTNFWEFSSDKLVAQPDTNNWKWNSQITMVNRKGFEIENKDPLGRYNAGLYGYNLTMPTAVVQNSRYRESAYEGFEDYDYVTQTCDTGCFAQRHMDYSPFKAKIVTTEKHTGKSSLRLNANEQAGLSFNMVTFAEDTVSATIQVNTANDACVAGGKALTSVQSTTNILQPLFSPIRGEDMVISAWVKEDRACNYESYTGNSIVINLTNSIVRTYTFRPAGPIIEGWQRYESVFNIPDGSRLITVSLRAAAVTTYFDDVRIHPYHASMKSFVYHPVNLRLMAELDENNYATFYEYDDDGTLIRLKKETERGIKTIKETRSALMKE